MVLDVVIDKCSNEKIAVIIALEEQQQRNQQMRIAHDKAIMLRCLVKKFVSLVFSSVLRNQKDINVKL